MDNVQQFVKVMRELSSHIKKGEKISSAEDELALRREIASEKKNNNHPKHRRK